MNQSKTLLIDLHFLPSLEYFCVLSNFNNITFEKNEHYIKQSYRNRCYINTANGVRSLTVPLTNKHGKVFYKDVRIDYSTRWQNISWRTIESAYKNSPYFEHYSDNLHKIIYSNKELIFDLNSDLLSYCLEALRWKKTISMTTQYEKVVKEPFSDLRSSITTRNTYIVREFYRPTPYYQVFGSGFEDNLSVLDLIFCTGPEAGRILMETSRIQVNK